VKVGDLMSHEVLSIAPDAGVEELSRVLAEKDLSSVPVIEGDRLVGVVSETDIIGKNGATVGEIMTAQPLTATEEMSLSELATLLTEKRIKRVPVVRGENVVGMISQRDLVRGMAGGVIVAQDLGHEVREVKSGAVHEVRAMAMELIWKCDDCGYLQQGGESPPDKCPECGAPREHFVSVTED
jgi:predicted transcriptional regulator/rubredoxin